MRKWRAVLQSALAGEAVDDRRSTAPVVNLLFTPFFTHVDLFTFSFWEGGIYFLFWLLWRDDGLLLFSHSLRLILYNAVATIAANSK